MTYLVYEDENGWRIARSDGRLDSLTKSYKNKGAACFFIRGMQAPLWNVYKLFKRVPQELRYMN